MTERIEDGLDDLLADYGDTTPGGAVAVVHGGELVATRAFGMADLERGVPNTTTTRFNLGSVSKQFTAFAVLLLEEEGALSLDDEVHRHIPELHDFGESITLRHLMHHTSGLRGTYPELLMLGGWRFTDHVTHEDCLRLVLDQRELSFSPGAEFLYVNANYVLLAETVARVSGAAFQDFCRDRIFEPVGMSHTLIQADVAPPMADRALGYYQDDDSGTWQNLTLTDTVLGPTNVYSTVDDMARWLRNLTTGHVGGPTVMERMRAPGALSDGSEVGYGGGLMVGSSREYRGLPLVEHGGQHGGYCASMQWFPTDDVAVILATNHFQWDTAETARRIADLVLGDSGPAPPPVPVEDRRVEITAEDLEPLQGLYYDQSRRQIRKVPLVDGALTYMDLALVPIGDRRFEFAEEPGSTVAFTGDGLVLTTAGGSYRYERIDPVPARPEEIRALAGRYESPELHVVWNVEIEGARLRIRRHKYVDTLAEPIHADAYNDDWAEIVGYPMTYLLEFERNDAGTVTGFRATGMRVRGLWFERC